jgi:hypothetical protein
MLQTDGYHWNIGRGKEEQSQWEHGLAHITIVHFWSTGLMKEYAVSS